MKRPKYNNKKVVIGGIKFDSKKEGARYKELLLLKSAKNPKDRIIKIELQPKFGYMIGYYANNNSMTKTAFYKADFRNTYADGRVEIEDVKGVRTVVYKRKKKIIETLYGIKIIEK